MNYLQQLIVLLFSFSSIKSARILVLTTHDTGSHQRGMAPFLERLCSNGHQLVLLDTIAPLRQTEFLPECVEIWRVPVDEANSDGLGSEEDKMLLRAQMVFNETYHSRFWPNNVGRNWKTGIVGQLAQVHSNELRLLLSNHWDLVIIDDWFCVHCHAIANWIYSRTDTEFIIFATTWPYHSATSAVAASEFITPNEKPFNWNFSHFRLLAINSHFPIKIADCKVWPESIDSPLNFVNGWQQKVRSPRGTMLGAREETGETLSDWANQVEEGQLEMLRIETIYSRSQKLQTK